MKSRMTIMIDDGKVPQFAQQGCWLTCHDGQRDMPKQFTSEEVKANALLTAIKKSDVRKYLPATRTDPSDWKTGKSVEEINQDQGRRRLRRSDPVARASLARGRHGR